jgi:hypothetical protein
MSRIEENQARQLDRSGRGMDGPRVAVADQQRQQPAVVEVGMRQQHGVERGRLERERDPVADRFVGAALEHPAVDQDPGAARGEQELRAGDRRGPAQELEVHPARGPRAR